MWIKTMLFTVVATASLYSQQLKSVSPQFKDYWYLGDAEVSTFELEQAKDGEIKLGQVVNIYEIETLTLENAGSAPISKLNVLKFNTIKRFQTGVSTYNTTTSTFYPVELGNASIKMTSSAQEWAGQSFFDLKNVNTGFVMNNYSYKKGESFFKKSLPKDVILESDVWSRLRIDYYELPQEEFLALPSVAFLRMTGAEIRPYNAIAKISRKEEYNEYSINYPELQRSLKIHFEKKFPYKVLGWTESYFSGTGSSAVKLTTSARLINVENIDYWGKSRNADVGLRKKIGLQ